MEAQNMIPRYIHNQQQSIEKRCSSSVIKHIKAPVDIVSPFFFFFFLEFCGVYKQETGLSNATKKMLNYYFC